MSKYRIFTVGFDLPGDEFEFIEFRSSQTLLDADIVLFEPTLGHYTSYESYNGKQLLSESTSFSVKEQLNHWKTEITAAIAAGKLVIVYLVVPNECYIYTGRQEFSGTGRSRVTTNIVENVSSYGGVPGLSRIAPKTGSAITLEKGATALATYWAEFSSQSPYKVEIEGQFKRVLLKSKAGNRIVGAEANSSAGTLLYLPPLEYDEDKFLKKNEKDGKMYWTKEAVQFGKRLTSALVNLADQIKQLDQSTPAPSWASNSEFRLGDESRLESLISEISGQISKHQTHKAALEKDLRSAGTLRHLLFEQGKPLESAILEALRLMGFSAQPLKDGESEFDAVFTSSEGRCLGEAEGKDNKQINIEKFSQLERNIQEDFARDGATEYAKGVLFGNAYRLIPPQERGEFFTIKCMSAAKRTHAALVRTPDLFPVARYLKENPTDTGYASRCREAMFKADGAITIFPTPPDSGSSAIATEKIEK